MISFELLYIIMSSDCRSPIVHRQRETVVAMCPVPEIYGPRVPSWWRPGMLDKAEPQPVKAKQKLAYKYPAKNKPSKKKRKGRR